MDEVDELVKAWMAQGAEGTSVSREHLLAPGRRERRRIDDELTLAREVLNSGLLCDPRVRNGAASLRVRIRGRCPRRLADRLDALPPDRPLPPELERRCAKVACDCLDRQEALRAASESDRDQMAQREAMILGKGNHVPRHWDVLVARPADWPHLNMVLYPGPQLAPPLHQEARADRGAEGPTLPPPEALFAPADFARMFDVPGESLRLRLNRWRSVNPDDPGWIEVADPRARQPRYLYRYGAVSHIIADLKSATSMATGSQPA